MEATGLREAQIREVAEELLRSDRTVFAWAMGLTQHKHSVASIQEMPDLFLDNLDREFGFASPREHGLDTVNTVRAMRDGQVRFFMAMGGNFVKATSDTAVTEAAMRSCEMTVQISTKLNHSHCTPGATALILPTLGRSDLDVQATGPQKVSVEDSMSVVHSSRGNLTPSSGDLLSEIAIVCRLARALFCDRDGRPRPGTPQAGWRAMEDDYRLIRRHIEAVVPGFTDYEERISEPGGFRLPHGPHDVRVFTTSSTKAHFVTKDLWWPPLPPGRLLLQTLRSHDQYNTTIYGPDDRYRGISGGRRVVMVHAEDLAELGFADGEVVDLVSEADDGVERRAEEFRIVAYDTSRGCAAAYYPETDVLVPLDSTADRSNTPTSKSVVIRLEDRS